MLTKEIKPNYLAAANRSDTASLRLVSLKDVTLKGASVHGSDLAPASRR